MIVTAIQSCTEVTLIFHVVPATNDAFTVSLDDLFCSLLIKVSRERGMC